MNIVGYLEYVHFNSPHTGVYTAGRVVSIIETRPIVSLAYDLH